jgi:hypothetical protein
MADLVPHGSEPPVEYTAVGKALPQESLVWVVCGVATYPDGKRHVLVWEASVKSTAANKIKVVFKDGTINSFNPSIDKQVLGPPILADNKVASW